MTAQLEEVVVTADLFALQDGFPDLGQGLLGFSLRGFVAAADVGVSFRGRQGFAVKLAVGGQRERFQLYVGTGHHVGGQVLFQLFADVCDVERVFVLGNQIGHQTFVSFLLFSRNDDGFFYSWQGR